MEKLHPVHRHQAADSSHPKTKPSSKQLRDITTWDPESKAQRSHILGSRRLHRQLTPRDSKAPKLQKMHIPAYRHTHPRSFGLWLAKSTQIKYPITHCPGQWLRDIKCTQTASVMSYVAIHNPKLPDTGYSPGRDTKQAQRPLPGHELHTSVRLTARCHMIQTE